jgi:hypothetical protein
MKYEVSKLVACTIHTDRARDKGDRERGRKKE